MYAEDLFNQIDEDKSGRVTYIELMVAFSAFKCKFDARLEREFRECDENSDGLIDQEEFSRYIKKCFEKINSSLVLKFEEILNNSNEVEMKRKKMIIEGRREDEDEILNKMDTENIKYDLMRY